MATEPPRTSADGEVATLDHALERICFLQWRLEQLESTVQDARRKNQSLRAELTQLTHEQSQDRALQLSLTERLAQSQREVQSVEERMALAERGRASAEDHSRQTQVALLTSSQGLKAEVERERQRAEVLSRALADARDRLDGLERSHARFFFRLEEWQQLLGTDPDRIDLAEFIAELRSDVIRLSGERDLSQHRERRLRLALVEAGGQVPTEPEFQSEPPRRAPPSATPTAQAEPLPTPPGPDLGSAAAVAAIKGAQQVINALHEDAAQTPEPVAAAHPLEPRPAAEDLRAALKSRMAHLNEDDGSSAFAHLPDELQARALPLTQEVAMAPLDLAQSAARSLLALDAEAGVPAIVARMQQDGETEPWLEVLSRSQGELAITVAERHMRSPTWRIRAASLQTLLALCDPQDHESILQRGLQDEHSHVRRRAALIAQAHYGREAEALLHPLLDDPCPGTRRLITTLLRGRGPSAASATLSTRRNSAWTK